jgi:hypothetical protein
MKIGIELPCKKKLTRWCQNSKVHHHIHSGPRPAPILSHLNPLCTLPASLPKIHSDLILLSTFWSSELVSFLWAFPAKSCRLFSSLSCVLHVDCFVFSGKLLGIRWSHENNTKALHSRELHIAKKINIFVCMWVCMFSEEYADHWFWSLIMDLLYHVSHVAGSCVNR